MTLSFYAYILTVANINNPLREHINVQEPCTAIYRTGVKLPSRCPILYLFNKYPY